MVARVRECACVCEWVCPSRCTCVYWEGITSLFSAVLNVRLSLNINSPLTIDMGQILCVCLFGVGCASTYTGAVCKDANEFRDGTGIA